MAAAGRARSIPPSPSGKNRRLRVDWIGAAIALVLSGCSFVLDAKTDQCETTGDCAKLRAGSVCDITHHVCVELPTGFFAPDAGAPVGADGALRSADGGTTTARQDATDAACASDAAVGRALFVSSCTTSTCIPFDNAQRLTRLLPGGGLAPIPVRP
jgi:hypothetical protein